MKLNFLGHLFDPSWQCRIQFAERSLVNQCLMQNFIQGVLLGWEGRAFRAYGSYNDGGGNANLAEVQANGNPTSWATTWRADWKLAGDWGQFKDQQGWLGSPFGAVVQGGVFVADAFELVARYEGPWVSSDRAFAALGAANALNSWTLNIVTVGANWYFRKNAVKLTADVGYSFNPVLFSNGLYGESIAGADWRPAQTGEGTGEVVVRAQMQLLF